MNVFKYLNLLKRKQTLVFYDILHTVIVLHPFLLFVR